MGKAPYMTDEGYRKYRQSLLLVLMAALNRLYKDADIDVHQSVNRSTYVEFKNMRITRRRTEEIKSKMRELIKADFKLKSFEVTKEEASRLLSETNPELAEKIIYTPRENVRLFEDMGRYYDTRKAYYSWRNYKIPTEVAAIEALQALDAQSIAAISSASFAISKQQTIEEMQHWLLMSKRTQVWDTPVNTVDAVYAFMKGNESNWSRKAENAVLKLDGKLLPMPQDSTTLGYVKTEKTGKASVLSIDKKSEYTSWGAVYAEFKQPISEIGSMESGIKIRRVIVPAESEGKGKAQAKVGEKVKVTLIITADRDYDFVKIADKRAACLEPVNQLSGYQWGMGCYVSPGDNTTNFYFDRLPKGKHIVEMEYYVDRKGDYQSGTCTAECTYSPEFGGCTEAYELKVNN